MPVTTHKGYHIHTSEMLVTGLFFRNPIYKHYYGVDDGFYACDSTPTLNLSKPSWIHRLLNTEKTFRDLKEFVTRDDAAGFVLRSLRSPVYFQRFERTLRIYDAARNLLFNAWGYHFVGEPVGGRCQKEVSEWFVGNTVIRERSDTGVGNADHAVGRLPAGLAGGLRGCPVSRQKIVSLPVSSAGQATPR